MQKNLTQITPGELLNVYETPTEEDANGSLRERAREEILRRLNLRLSPEQGSTQTEILEARHPTRNQDKEPIRSLIETKYEHSHTTPGRSGTRLTFQTKHTIDLTRYATHTQDGKPQDVPQVRSEILFDETETGSIEDGMSKLAEWCRRAAEALEAAPEKLKNKIPC